MTEYFFSGLGRTFIKDFPKYPYISAASILKVFCRIGRLSTSDNFQKAADVGFITPKVTTASRFLLN
jgi:hypothetical protein